MQWTLQLPDTGQAYCHALGMGKPLGMGSVKLQPCLHLTSRQQRYEKLFAGNQWQTGEDGSDSQQDFCAAFEQSVLGKLPAEARNKATKLTDVPRIQMLLIMLEWQQQDSMLVSKQPIDGLTNLCSRWVLPDPLHIGPFSSSDQQGDGKNRGSPPQDRSNRGRQTGRSQRGGQGVQKQHPTPRTPTTSRSTLQQPTRNVPAKQTTPPPTSPPQPATKSKPAAAPRSLPDLHRARCAANAGILLLHFLSPTSFKQGPGDLPLPLPANVYSSLRRAWNAFALPVLHLEEAWLGWCAQNIFITAHDIHTVVVPFNRHADFTGFVGHLPRPSRRR